MGQADEWYAVEDRLEQPGELAAMTINKGDGSWESANDESGTSWEAFVDEIDAWARRTLAANGFGDY
jgi:hypothetical protein